MVRTAEGHDLTATDRRKGESALIAALAGGASVVDAAAAAGISEATAHRRLRESEFRRRVDEVRAEILLGAMAQLSAATTGAVETLTSLLVAESESVRLGAARSILDTALRWREQADLAERLDAVEAWVDAFADAESVGGKAQRWR